MLWPFAESERSASLEISGVSLRLWATLGYFTSSRTARGFCWVCLHLNQPLVSPSAPSGTGHCASLSTGQDYTSAPNRPGAPPLHSWASGLRSQEWEVTGFPGSKSEPQSLSKGSLPTAPSPRGMKLPQVSVGERRGFIYSLGALLGLNDSALSAA